MKHFCFLIFSLITFSGFSQSTTKFINYQAVIREIDNTPMAPGTTVNVTIDLFNSILDANPSYSEVHAVTIPPTFVINLQIGNGNPTSGTYSLITWQTGNAAYAVKVNTSTAVPKQRFAYVPYAFYAEKSGNSKAYIAGTGIKISNDTISNLGASTNLTLNGNLLSAGANSVALTTYTGGNGIVVNGIPPNLGISLNITGTNTAWNTLGNLGTDQTLNYIGTADNNDLYFKTNGSQRMVIKNNGKISIGTNSNPAENLQIESTTNSSVSIVSPTTSYLFFGNPSTHALGGIKYDNFNNTMMLSTNSSTQIQIDANGNLGVGITPAEPLHVIGKTRTDSIQVRGPVTPTVQSVLVSRDNQGNAKWAAPINFKGAFAPTGIINVTSATFSNIGNTAGYSSNVLFNNSPSGGLVFNNLGGTYTVPETGVYYFDASIMVAINSSAVGNNYIALEIYNSTTSIVLQRVMQSNADAALTLNTVLKASTTALVNKNDAIILRVMGSTATAGAISNTFPSTDKMNSFSGFLIR